MRTDYFNKLNDSINLIWKYDAIAQKYGGYKVAFSGGKDSQVMLDIFKKSGVKFTAHYNVTTNDPPENVYFIKKQYHEVQFIHPKRTYLQLIEDKGMLPTMLTRFCCSCLKESYGKGFVAVGVRREESAKRAQYEPIVFSNRNHQTFDADKMTAARKVVFRPILDWTEADIWQYIEDQNIPVNPCYETAGRVGCMFCPFAQRRNMLYNRKRYPKHYALILRTIERIMEKGYMRDYQPLTAEQVFMWWISKENSKAYFSQLELDL